MLFEGVPPWCWMVCPLSISLVSDLVSSFFFGGFILHFPQAVNCKGFLMLSHVFDPVPQKTLLV